MEIAIDMAAREGLTRYPFWFIVHFDFSFNHTTAPTLYIKILKSLFDL